MASLSKNGRQPPATLASLQLFREPKHQPFSLDAGCPTAVLVHGFLGSPAEFRPLATHLHQAGWSIRALLLPGFGPDIDTLFTRTSADWIGSVLDEVEKLKRHGRPVLLTGYSLGAAVAINVAAQAGVDSLILIAPFWKLGGRREKLIWTIVKRLFPRFQPFRRADFSDPRMQKFVENTMPELDPNDPRIEPVLRSLTVPRRFVDEIISLGKTAEQAAPTLQIPTAIVQGTRDESVKPAATRRLLTLLGGPVIYEEVDTDHELVKADNPGFQSMSRFILDYASRLRVV